MLKKATIKALVGRECLQDGSIITSTIYWGKQISYINKKNATTVSEWPQRDLKAQKTPIVIYTKEIGLIGIGSGMARYFLC